MILIPGTDIYCKKKLYDGITKKTKSKTSDLARHLMLGSIETDYLLFCTITGKVGNNRKNKVLDKNNVLKITPKIYDIIGKLFFFLL